MQGSIQPDRLRENVKAVLFNRNIHTIFARFAFLPCLTFVVRPSHSQRLRRRTSSLRFLHALPVRGSLLRRHQLRHKVFQFLLNSVCLRSCRISRLVIIRAILASIFLFDCSTLGVLETHTVFCHFCRNTKFVRVICEDIVSKIVSVGSLREGKRGKDRQTGTESGKDKQNLLNNVI